MTMPSLHHHMSGTWLRHLALALLAICALSSASESSLSGSQSLLANQRQNIFDQIDTNGNDKVNRKEFYSFVEATSNTALISRDELRAEFDNYDSDGDGRLSIDEIFPLPDDQAPVDIGREMELIFDQLDANKNGKISFREYRQFVKANHPKDVTLPSNEDLRASFDFVDSDGDGRLTEKEILDLFNKVDANGNGRVTLREYRNWLRSVIPEGIANPSGSEIKAQFATLDRDGDKRLSLSELFLPSTIKNAPSPADEFRVIRTREEAFAEFDTNNDGVVDAKELRAFGETFNPTGESLTDEEIALILKQLDTNGSGFLEIDEIIPQSRADSMIEQMNAM